MQQAHVQSSVRVVPPRGYIFALLAAVALGVASASYWPSLSQTVRQTLLVIGEAHLASLDARQVQQAGRSQYIVVLQSDDWRDVSTEFFARHPEIEYLGESTFPRSLRVNLSVPVSSAKGDLESQPFVSWVVPATPLFLCH